MRKKALVLVFVLLLSMALPMSVAAAQPRTISIIPELTIEGTTATCNVAATANNTSEHLRATIKLWREGTCISTWIAEGDGYIFFSKMYPVIPGGYTFKLTVDLTVDGVPFPQAYVTAR